MGVAEEGKESQAVGRLGDSSWTWPGLLIRTITICWQAIKCRAGLGWVGIGQRAGRIRPPKEAPAAAPAPSSQLPAASSRIPSLAQRQLVTKNPHNNCQPRQSHMAWPGNSTRLSCSSATTFSTTRWLALPTLPAAVPTPGADPTPLSAAVCGS